MKLQEAHVVEIPEDEYDALLAPQQSAHQQRLQKHRHCTKALTIAASARQRLETARNQLRDAGQLLSLGDLIDAEEEERLRLEAESKDKKKGGGDKKKKQVPLLPDFHWALHQTGMLRAGWPLLPAVLLGCGVVPLPHCTPAQPQYHQCPGSLQFGWDSSTPHAACSVVGRLGDRYVSGQVQGVLS